MNVCDVTGCLTGGRRAAIKPSGTGVNQHKPVVVVSVLEMTIA